ncbi:hypothetical protein EEF82_10920, partial [Neisseria gonorrhoeae]
MPANLHSVIPTKVGIRNAKSKETVLSDKFPHRQVWIPAYAGMTAAGIGGFGGVGGFGGLKPALVYRNFRIIATNRPAATRARPRQTTVARL